MIINTSNSYKRGVSRFYPKLNSFWSCRYMNCCQHYMLQINLHVLYIHFIKFNINLKEFQESINYFKSCQANKIGYFVEIYFNLNLHLHLNIKSDFQVNSQLSTFLCGSPVNIKEFFSMSHHIIMVLIVIQDSNHDLKCKPKMQTLKVNMTVMRHHK